MPAMGRRRAAYHVRPSRIKTRLALLTVRLLRARPRLTLETHAAPAAPVMVFLAAGWECCLVRSRTPENLQDDTFSKKCALTSPANVAGLDAGGPTRPFYTAARLIGRRGAEVRRLVVF
jgi:hypothetical protein